MDNMIAFWKNLKLRQFVVIFVAGLLLIVTTSCSGANPQGSKPQNPAVQAGGANNPDKGGGDKYTKYRMSTDTKAMNSEEKKEIERASSQSSQSDLQLLIAISRDSEILYPGADTPQGRVEKEKELPIITDKNFQRPAPGGWIQREPDIGTRIQERVETVQDSVKEASGFLQEKAKEANSRPELQKNPAVGK
jgi:hypothetical protein